VRSLWAAFFLFQLLVWLALGIGKRFHGDLLRRLLGGRDDLALGALDEWIFDDRVFAWNDLELGELHDVVFGHLSRCRDGVIRELNDGVLGQRDGCIVGWLTNAPFGRWIGWIMRRLNDRLIIRRDRRRFRDVVRCFRNRILGSRGGYRVHDVVRRFDDGVPEVWAGSRLRNGIWDLHDGGINDCIPKVRCGGRGLSIRAFSDRVGYWRPDLLGSWGSRWCGGIVRRLHCPIRPLPLIACGLDRKLNAVLVAPSIWVRKRATLAALVKPGLLGGNILLIWSLALTAAVLRDSF
jgi:hypothetical protein